MAEPECDALAILVVKLESDQHPGEGDLSWHTWRESPGAAPHGLPANARGTATQVEPFKRLPGESALPYFNQHVERLLFPPADKRGERLLCCPDRLYLELAETAGGPRRRTRIDLLERVTTPLEPNCTFGLIHLSLLPSEEAGAPDSLWWRRSIAAPFRWRGEQTEFVLRRGESSVDLADQRPVRSLTKELFGDPDPYLERSLYTIVMAQCPIDGGSPGEEEAWRRALALGRLETRLEASNDPGEERERQQTIRLAGATGLLLGQCAAFTLTEPISRTYARNFRSYWGESIVFGLLQQDCLDEFQRRLADIGDPLNPDVEQLRRDWLEFRNVLWWSQLSRGSRVPQELLTRLRDELGTERLFTDLEEDLATYSEQQHQAVEGRQAAALANLQKFGAPIVVLGPVTTAIGLVGATGGLLAALLAGSLLLAIGVFFLVDWLLKREQRPAF